MASKGDSERKDGRMRSDCLWTVTPSTVTRLVSFALVSVALAAPARSADDHDDVVYWVDPSAATLAAKPAKGEPARAQTRFTVRASSLRSHDAPARSSQHSAPRGFARAAAENRAK